MCLELLPTLPPLPDLSATDEPVSLDAASLTAKQPNLGEEEKFGFGGLMTSGDHHSCSVSLCIHSAPGLAPYLPDAQTVEDSTSCTLASFPSELARGGPPLFYDEPRFRCVSLTLVLSLLPRYSFSHLALEP